VTFSQKQQTFCVNVGHLIAWAFARGYRLTFGEAYRPPETAALYAQQGRGIAASLHTKRLAVDFNVFRDGQYLTLSESLRPLGDFWKTLDVDNAWGGDFSTKPDGNHFSMQHEGIR
jgi:hypothetical protein